MTPIILNIITFDMFVGVIVFSFLGLSAARATTREPKECPYGQYKDPGVGKCDLCKPYCDRRTVEEIPAPCKTFCDTPSPTTTTPVPDGGDKPVKKEDSIVSTVLICLAVGAGIIFIVTGVVCFVVFRRRRGRPPKQVVLNRDAQKHCGKLATQEQTDATEQRTALVTSVV